MFADQREHLEAHSWFLHVPRSPHHEAMEIPSYCPQQDAKFNSYQ